MPLIGIAVVKGASQFGLVHDDRVYQFVLLLQFAVPPAMNISTLIQQVIFLASHLLLFHSLWAQGVPDRNAPACWLFSAKK